MNYSDYAQSDTYIGEYMRMMSAQETPLAYDFWCACWTIGVVLGRRYKILRPRAPVYMNSYMILVADSGITRKSTAVSAATRVVREYIDTYDRSTAILDGRVTAGMIMQTMVDMNNGGTDAQVALSISELAATMGRGSGAHEIPVLLTDLYDAPTFRRGGSKSAGAYEIRNAYVSLLAASTPAWLLRAVSPNVVEGGFTSRCIFVVADKRKNKIAWPEEQTDDDRTQTKRLVDLLHQRACQLDAGGQNGIVATTAAVRQFTDWYRARRSYSDVYRSSFDSRADAHVLRVAACLCISDASYSIQARHISQAISLVVQSREDAARLFSGGTTTTAPKHIRAFDKLRTVLVDAGRDGISQAHVTLALSHYADASLTARILDAMHDLDMVQKAVLQPSQKGGRSKTVWRATKLINSKHAQEIIEYLSRPDTIIEGKQHGTDSADV